MKDENNPRQKERIGKAERLQMVEQFWHSGLDRRAFCKREGIPLSTLDWWQHKAKQGGQESAGVEFREVRVEPMAGPAMNWSVEILSPDGWTLRCREGWAASDMARLLKSLKC
jgi:transposase